MSETAPHETTALLPQYHTSMLEPVQGHENYRLTMLNARSTETDACATEDSTDSLLPFIPTHYSLFVVHSTHVLSLLLSSFFLVFYVLVGALLKSIPSMLWTLSSWIQFKDPGRNRPFYEQEKARKHLPRGLLKCDIDYYAKRVGLSCEESKIETEDGFILTLQHIIDKSAGCPPPERISFQVRLIIGKYPVLLLHGLLQSSGTFCVNDESSLAFFLCKSGYDVWLGNNRGYFDPEHIELKPSSHKFWAWNLLQMGTLDLPAMITYIRAQTGRQKVLDSASR
jgi:Partial alpha/beta-hydrolase lipase region